MKRKSSIVIIAAIVLSLIIPIGLGSAPVAKAATKTPAKAHVPELVQLWPWADTIYFEQIGMPKNAKSVQMYLRTTGKKVKTVKKNSYWHKKYKKNKKKYIIVKAKRKNRYNVYKAGKWRVILTTSKNYAQCKKPLKADKVYQIKFRGKNGKKLGKSSPIIQFKNVSKQLRKDYITDYNMWREERKKDLDQAKVNLSLPDDEDDYMTRQDHYDEDLYLYETVEIQCGHILYVDPWLADMPVPDMGTDIYKGMESEGKLL